MSNDVLCDVSELEKALVILWLKRQEHPERYLTTETLNRLKAKEKQLEVGGLATSLNE